MAIHQLHTEIEIEAPAERVWAVLTDFAAYPEWNPFVRSVAGVARKGERLQVEIRPDGGRAMRFSPVVLAAEAGRELRWLGRVLLPGIFDGEHVFVIEPLEGGRVRLRQSERFGGILVGLFRAQLDRDTLRGFEAMNRALKQRSEEPAPSRPVTG